MLLKYPRGSGSGERVGEQEHKKWEQSRELTNKLQIGLGFKPGGGDSHRKGVGVLIISLRGENFRFWSHLGCAGQNTLTFSPKDLF